jgi:hypothetical protein
MSLAEWAVLQALSAGDDRTATSASPVRCEGCDGRRTDVLTNRPRRVFGIRIGWINEAWCTACYRRDVERSIPRRTEVWWLPGGHPTTWGPLLESLPEDGVSCACCAGVRGPIEYAVWEPTDAPGAAVESAWLVCTRDFDDAHRDDVWPAGTTAAYIGRQYDDGAIEAADAAYDDRVALHFAKDTK